MACYKLGNLLFWVEVLNSPPHCFLLFSIFVFLVMLWHKIIALLTVISLSAAANNEQNFKTFHNEQFLRGDRGLKNGGKQRKPKQPKKKAE